MGARARIVGALAAAALSTGAIGALHLPEARPVLLWITGGSCPIGEELSPEARAAARVTAVASVRGDVAAPARPAMGLALGETGRADALAWAAARGLACAEDNGGLRCEGGTSSPEDVWLELDAADRVVGVVSTARDLTPAAAATAFAEAEGALAGVGDATLRRDADLSRTLAQRLVEYRFADYRAQITATNVGGGRVTVRAAWQDLGS